MRKFIRKWQSAISLVKPSKGAVKLNIFNLLNSLSYIYIILISYDSIQMTETTTQECAKTKVKGERSSSEKFT